MAPAFGEETLLRAAHAYEQMTEWHKQRAIIERANHLHVE